MTPYRCDVCGCEPCLCSYRRAASETLFGEERTHPEQTDVPTYTKRAEGPSPRKDQGPPPEPRDGCGVLLVLFLILALSAGWGDQEAIKERARAERYPFIDQTRAVRRP